MSWSLEIVENSVAGASCKIEQGWCLGVSDGVVDKVSIDDGVLQFELAVSDFLIQTRDADFPIAQPLLHGDRSVFVQVSLGFAVQTRLQPFLYERVGEESLTKFTALEGYVLALQEQLCGVSDGKAGV